MTLYSVTPLCIGVNETDQGIMTYQRGYGKRIHLPIYAFLLRGGGENILVDTGLSDFMVPEDLPGILGFPVLPFEEALAAHGLTPEDVSLVIHTHLHNDHCENDALCTRAKVIVQRAELDFFRNPHPLDHRYYPDLLDGCEEVEAIEGEATPRPGITLLPTPGHTPGGQTVIVETKAGRVVITGFCCNGENFPKTGPAVASGVHTDAIAAWESAQRVKTLGGLLLPLHDIAVGRRGTIGG